MPPLTDFLTKVRIHLTTRTKRAFYPCSARRSSQKLPSNPKHIWQVFLMVSPPNTWVTVPITRRQVLILCKPILTCYFSFYLCTRHFPSHQSPFMSPLPPKCDSIRLCRYVLETMQFSSVLLRGPLDSRHNTTPNVCDTRDSASCICNQPCRRYNDPRSENVILTADNVTNGAI